MHDPIGGFERVRDLYLTYLETAFRIEDDGVSRERRVLLERPRVVGKATDTLATPPLVEPVPRYAPARRPGSDGGLRLDHLAGDDGAALLPEFSRDERRAFVDLALAGLFESSSAPDGSREADFPLYEHQADLLARGVRPGRPGVVTSGTGSGKTEAFLLPVFAQIAKEATTWPAPAPGYLQHRWWQEPNGFQLHREGEHPDRPAAVRALVLYPMNALVEDQLTRVRKALDSPEARAVMDDRFDGNRIFFGRYTSASPVTNYLDHPRPGQGEAKRRKRKVDALAGAMAAAEQTQTAARARDAAARAAHERGEGDDPDPTRYLFPSTDGAELLSRWDVQRTPPDLLVTNTSMLSAMLVREVDAPPVRDDASLDRVRPRRLLLPRPRRAPPPTRLGRHRGRLPPPGPPRAARAHPARAPPQAPRPGLQRLAPRRRWGRPRSEPPLPLRLLRDERAPPSQWAAACGRPRGLGRRRRAGDDAAAPPAQRRPPRPRPVRRARRGLRRC